MKKFLLFAFAIILFAACNNNEVPDLTGISLDKDKLKMEIGDTYNLRVLFEPEEAAPGAPEITWESTKEHVASVDEKGLVTAKQQGKATINVFCGKFVAECAVEVISVRETEFLLGDYGIKVRFAPGNLQYQPSTNTWRFAENQYDIIGEDNLKISDTYEGWIDLFGWGTGMTPLVTSNENKEYPLFIDWGDNPISNYKEKTWYTLAKEDWEMVLKEGTEGCEWVNVVGVNGCLLLPINFGFPEGMDRNTKTFSKEEWKLMEKHGAVFFPAAGNRFRENNDAPLTVADVSEYGYYWTRTTDDPEADPRSAYYLTFGVEEQQPSFSSFARREGYSVRLAQFYE